MVLESVSGKSVKVADEVSTNYRAGLMRLTANSPAKVLYSIFCIKTMSSQRLNLRPTSISIPTSRNPHAV